MGTTSERPVDPEPSQPGHGQMIADDLMDSMMFNMSDEAWFTDMFPPLWNA
jgi:hypothetical protein